MNQDKPDPQLKEISEKLSTLIQVSIANLLKNAKNQREKIILLSEAGLQPATIAELLDTTSNTVYVELSIMRKEKKTKKSKNDETEKQADAFVESNTDAVETKETIPTEK